MKIELDRLQSLLQFATGLDCDIHFVSERQFSILPAFLIELNSFKVNVTVGWKRVEIAFEAGSLAGELLERMGQVNEESRHLFCSIFNDCANQGAIVNLKVNNVSFHPSNPECWKARWTRLELELRYKGLSLDMDTDEVDTDGVYKWVVRFFALIVTILPIENTPNEDIPIDHTGFAEGTMKQSWTGRYERDPRNRAAAIAIHGTSCAACGMDFGKTYGPVAEGYIHVHHVVPVSKLSESHLIDPTTDLIPLCPNCHAVAHRRDPPLNVTEIQELLENSIDKADDRSA